MQDISAGISAAINQDVNHIKQFSTRQLKALAMQADLISAGILAGDINEDLQSFFLSSLNDMVLNLAKTLQGLIIVSIEKVCNIIMAVLTSAISTVTGINFSEL